MTAFAGAVVTVRAGPPNAHLIIADGGFGGGRIANTILVEPPLVTTRIVFWLKITVVTEAGPVEIDVPRDQESTCEPVIVAKRQLPPL